MNALKNRTVALLLAAVLVVGSTLLSASAKLKKDIQQVTNGFYTGTLYDGEKTAEVPDASGSIYKQLTVITGEVDKICAIISNSGADAEALKDASYYLKSNLSSMHEYIDSIYYSYSELCDALTAIKPKLGAMGLSESEYEEINTSLTLISAAQSVIADSGYNESVRRYRSSMGILAEFFADICGIYEPEFFA